ncbi:hypothetical protein [Cupriavidus sp. BIC8F]|uniref:hypothetical protein n=1 Tax=Cupriavidus sp. BIC8F TaxID=3079014 RepID=UPI00291664DB|nr:hypothetical protein [Cupriavidus sp. BIC8F]
MDKLQMTVTLSADSAPDLLAYLRQYPGARERAFMLKLLAQRGLQLVLSSGPDTLLRPHTVATAPIVAPSALDAPLRGRPDRSASSEEEPPAPYAAVSQISPSSPAAVRQLVVERPQHALASAAEGQQAAPVTAPVLVPVDPGIDPLAGLDVGALNDAMARFG